MFDTIPKPEMISGKSYRQQVQELRQELLELQRELRETSHSVVLVMAGVDGAGKGATVNVLNEWMDPRWIETHAYERASEEEAERPPHWRYWRDLPARGTMACFLSAWYSRPLLDRVYGGTPEAFERALDQIAAFEQMLAEDGAIVVKFWMHLDRDAQLQRLRTMANDPLHGWRVTKRDWYHWHAYGEFVAAASRLVERTSTGLAPWILIDGSDERHRELALGRALARAVRSRIDAAKSRGLMGKADQRGAVKPISDEMAAQTALGKLQMLEPIPKTDYLREVERQQARFSLLHQRLREMDGSLILVFEGVDAAGKGGAIRRMIAPLDARYRRVIPIAAPTDEEHAHHYLWRFWRHLPRAGRVTVFDRSWYGRLLVERIEGFCSEPEWQRAYAEINAFERQLTDHGLLVLKFWIHISPDEQLQRFEARKVTPHKAWKLTDEDWRNRERWKDYEVAASEAFERTSTAHAPWVLIGGDDKRAARVEVLRTVCDHLEAGLRRGRGWHPRPRGY